jgi:hypothetical protein
MSEKIISEKMSRRGVLSLLGLGTALVSVVPAAMLTASEAEAQTVGVTRRQARREGRRDRREDRRNNRQERRANRRGTTTAKPQ